MTRGLIVQQDGVIPSQSRLLLKSELNPASTAASAEQGGGIYYFLVDPPAQEQGVFILAIIVGRQG